MSAQKMGHQQCRVAHVLSDGRVFSHLHWPDGTVSPDSRRPGSQGATFRWESSISGRGLETPGVLSAGRLGSPAADHRAAERGVAETNRGGEFNTSSGLESPEGSLVCVG